MEASQASDVGSIPITRLTDFDMPPISIDAILSDPQLLVGSALLILGPITFLFAFVKFIRVPRSRGNDFALPPEDMIAPPEEENAFDPTETGSRAGAAPSEEPPPPPVEPAIPEPPRPSAQLPDADKTVVLPAGVSDLQAQVDIALSQLRSLSRKVGELEENLETVSRHAAARLDTGEMNEPPKNAEDFARKLLILAEHVLVLEKEMVRLRGQRAGAAPAPGSAPQPQQKPPIMPL